MLLRELEEVSRLKKLKNRANAINRSIDRLDKQDYEKIQRLLRSYKSQNLTNIRLNSSKRDLLNELEKIKKKNAKTIENADDELELLDREEEFLVTAVILLYTNNSATHIDWVNEFELMNSRGNTSLIHSLLEVNPVGYHVPVKDKKIFSVILRESIVNIKETADRLLAERVVELQNETAWISSIKIEDYQIQLGSDVAVIDIPMRNHLINYVWSDHVQCVSGQSCVETWFLTNIANKSKYSNPCSKYYVTLDKLRQITQKTQKKALEGYSIRDVQKICEYYNFGMMAYNIDFDLLFERKNTTREKIIAFVNSDNHFYPIKSCHIRYTCKDIVTTSIKQRRYVLRGTEYDFPEFNPLVVSKTNDPIIFKSEIELIDKLKRARYVKFDGMVRGIITNKHKYGLEYISEEDNLDLLEDYIHTGCLIPFSPSPGDLGTKLMPDLSSVHHLNFHDAIIPIFQLQLQEFLELKLELESLDIKRCYTNCLDNDFLQLTCLSKIEKYVNPPDEPGYYYGLHKSKIFDLGYVWYPIIDIRKNPLTNIQYKVKCNLISKPFKKFLETTENLNFSKQIVNHSIGVLRKNTIRKYKSYRTSCFEQAVDFVKKGYKIRKINDIYIAVREYKTPKFKNSRHIHDQILWRAYDKVLELCGYFREVYSIKTDSVCGVLKDSLAIPDWVRQDTVHQKITTRKIIPKQKIIYESEHEELFLQPFDTTECYDYTKKVDIIKKYLKENNNFLINGIAGSAKTRLLRAISSIFVNENKKIISLAVTNIPARGLTNKNKNIRGYTLEMFLNKFNNQDLSKYYALMIDEIGLWNEDQFQYLVHISLMYPHLRIIIAGDFDQLPPIDQSDLYNSVLFRSICNYNELKLTKNYRNNLDYAIDYQKNDFQESKENHKTNICYTNKTRVFVNEQCMNVFAPPDAKAIPFMDMGYKTFIKLYPELPLRIKINQKKKDLFNGDIRTYEQLSKLYTDDEIMKIAVPAYCLTLYAVQGKTINEPYTIYDADYIFRNIRMKYTAYSRCTKKENVYVKN